MMSSSTSCTLAVALLLLLSTFGTPANGLLAQRGHAVAPGAAFAGGGKNRFNQQRCNCGEDRSRHPGASSAERSSSSSSRRQGGALYQSKEPTRRETFGGLLGGTLLLPQVANSFNPTVAVKVRATCALFAGECSLRTDSGHCALGPVRVFFYSC